jgi:hypothetical protein
MAVSTTTTRWNPGKHLHMPVETIEDEEELTGHVHRSAELEPGSSEYPPFGH